jgi:hypothetical protein
MKQFTKLFLIATAAVSLFAATLAFAAPQALAASFDGAKDAACGGASLEGGSKACDTAGDQKKVNDTITTAINIISFIVGVAAVIMIIIGGFKFITAQGDSAGIASARNTILYAIIGLVVVAMAQFIVKFVLTKL